MPASSIGADKMMQKSVLCPLRSYICHMSKYLIRELFFVSLFLHCTAEIRKCFVNLLIQTCVYHFFLIR